MIENSLYSALSGHAALSAIVGTRISPALSVQAGTMPCVTFHQTTGNYNYTQDGPDANVEDWWQFNVWGRSYESMRAASVAIINALHAGTGFHAFVDQRQDLYEDETRIHHGLIVARIWWVSEAVSEDAILFDDAPGNFDDMTGNFDTPGES